MANLIDLDRALSQIPNAPPADYGVIGEIVSACSAVVENYCRRTFAQATYDELLHGTGTTYLDVSNPPITKVISVRTGQLPAIQIQCNDPTNQTQLATVDVTSSAVVLTRTYNAVTTTTTFSFASYPTFATLGTAVNALGSGWTATVNTQFALWMTSDMTESQGSFSARNMTVPLMVYWWSLPFFKVDQEQGEIYSGSGFVQGYQAYRVTYIGGYDPIPDDIQQAVAELTQLVYVARKQNPSMQSETLGAYSYTRAATTSLDLLSPAAKMALTARKLMRVARWE